MFPLETSHSSTTWNQKTGSETLRRVGEDYGFFPAVFSWEMGVEPRFGSKQRVWKVQHLDSLVTGDLWQWVSLAFDRGCGFRFVTVVQKSRTPHRQICTQMLKTWTKKRITKDYQFHQIVFCHGSEIFQRFLFPCKDSGSEICIYSLLPILGFSINFLRAARIMNKHFLQLMEFNLPLCIWLFNGKLSFTWQHFKLLKTRCNVTWEKSAVSELGIYCFWSLTYFQSFFWKPTVRTLQPAQQYHGDSIAVKSDNHTEESLFHSDWVTLKQQSRSSCFQLKLGHKDPSHSPWSHGCVKGCGTSVEGEKMGHLWRGFTHVVAGVSLQIPAGIPRTDMKLANPVKVNFGHEEAKAEPETERWTCSEETHRKMVESQLALVNWSNPNRVLDTQHIIFFSQDLSPAWQNDASRKFPWTLDFLHQHQPQLHSDSAESMFMSSFTRGVQWQHKFIESARKNFTNFQSSFQFTYICQNQQQKDSSAISSTKYTLSA